MSRESTLHRELLEQARHLATRRPRQPRQADLRRAASAAYYSLFHFLIDEACRYFLGSSRDDRPLRTILARAFVHGEMANASKSFKAGKGALPAGLASYLDSVPEAVTSIAEVFTDIQGIQHQADYDPGTIFVPEDVMALIDRVDAAMREWKEVRDHPAARLYLLSLLVYDRIRSRK